MKRFGKAILLMLSLALLAAVLAAFAYSRFALTNFARALGPQNQLACLISRNGIELDWVNYSWKVQRLREEHELMIHVPYSEWRAPIASGMGRQPGR